jgi:CheY-like chemotaxis protein
VISDIGMPGASGLDLATRIRARPVTERVALIALTAHNRAEDRTDALRAGFDLHIGKPVEPLMLVRAVAGIADRRNASGREVSAVPTAPAARGEPHPTPI